MFDLQACYFSKGVCYGTGAGRSSGSWTSQSIKETSRKSTQKILSNGIPDMEDKTTTPSPKKQVSVTVNEMEKEERIPIKRKKPSMSCIVYFILIMATAVGVTVYIQAKCEGNRHQINPGI